MRSLILVVSLPIFTLSATCTAQTPEQSVSSTYASTAAGTVMST